MGLTCVALRIDEFDDGRSVLDAVGSLKTSGITFLSTESFHRFFDQSELPATYCAHLSVFAFTNEFATLATRQLGELNVPFLLVSSPQHSAGIMNWPERVSRLIHDANLGRYRLGIGGGVVNYTLDSLQDRELAKLNVIRRLSLLSWNRKSDTIRAIEAALAENSTEDHAVSQHIDFAQTTAGWPPESGLQELDNLLTTTAADRSKRTAAALFRNRYWESESLDPEPYDYIFEYSYSARLCHAAGFGSGRLPQMRVPRDQTAIEALKKRLDQRQVDTSWSLAGVVARLGGKRAAISLARSLLTYYCGGYQAYKMPDFSRVRRIVFFCKGNINRSAYAASLISSRYGVDSGSFGLSANNSDSASLEAQERAHREGLDLTRHVTTAVNSFEIRSSDLVVGFEPAQVHAHKLNHSVNAPQYSLLGLWTPFPWPYIQDPIVRSELYYEQCFDLIADGVENLAIAFRTFHSPEGAKEL